MADRDARLIHEPGKASTRPSVAALRCKRKNAAPFPDDLPGAIAKL